MIWNKIQAIKDVRTFCENTFGKISGLKVTKDLIEQLAEDAEKQAINEVADRIKTFLPLQGEYQSFHIEIMRRVVHSAFLQATGKPIVEVVDGELIKAVSTESF